MPTQPQTFSSAPRSPAATPGRRGIFTTTLGLVLAAALAAGCSAGTSPARTVSGWFGGDAAAAKGADVFYASSGGLNVHAEAKASSRVIGRLSAGERVVRSKQKDGFARIEARRGAVKGWVVNSRLLRRPPAAKPAPGAATGGDAVAPIAPDATAEDVTDEAPESESPDSSEAAETTGTAESSEPAEATAPTVPEPAPKGIGASVFDPY